MQQVAQAAGVAKATVSLALRNDPRIREKTRSHVQAIAREMGYRPNAMVANLMANLRTTRPPKYQATLGYLTPDPVKDERHPFCEWVKGFTRRAGQVGYEVDKFWLNEPGLTPKRFTEILKARGIQGVVISAVLKHRRLPAEFKEVWSKFACVVIGTLASEPPVHFVSNDQYYTAFQAVESVVRLGYRRPALVVDSNLDLILDHRFSSGFWGARRLLPGGRILPAFEFFEDADAESCEKLRLWLLRHNPDVIITPHIQVKRWLEKIRIAVPKEIGLVHLDRSADKMADWAGMNQNNDLVGMAAVDMLVTQLHHNEIGTPAFTQCLLIESNWVDGKTVKRR